MGSIVRGIQKGTFDGMKLNPSYPEEIHYVYNHVGPHDRAGRVEQSKRILTNDEWEKMETWL